jgi:hypothetical protein
MHSRRGCFDSDFPDLPQHSCFLEVLCRLLHVLATWAPHHHSALTDVEGKKGFFIFTTLLIFLQQLGNKIVPDLQLWLHNHGSTVGSRFIDS